MATPAAPQCACLVSHAVGRRASGHAPGRIDRHHGDRVVRPRAACAAAAQPAPARPAARPCPAARRPLRPRLSAGRGRGGRQACFGRRRLLRSSPACRERLCKAAACAVCDGRPVRRAGRVRPAARAWVRAHIAPVVGLAAGAPPAGCERSSAAGRTRGLPAGPSDWRAAAELDAQLVGVWQGAHQSWYTPLERWVVRLLTCRPCEDRPAEKRLPPSRATGRTTPQESRGARVGQAQPERGMLSCTPPLQVSTADDAHALARAHADADADANAKHKEKVCTQMLDGHRHRAARLLVRTMACTNSVACRPARSVCSECRSTRRAAEMACRTCCRLPTAPTSSVPCTGSTTKRPRPGACTFVLLY